MPPRPISRTISNRSPMMCVCMLGIPGAPRTVRAEGSALLLIVARARRSGNGRVGVRGASLDSAASVWSSSRMALSIEVPLSTALADLDEALRSLLRRELARHSMGGVEIAFEAPTREGAAALSSPTVNLFLYDIRENTEHREASWRTEQENGRARSRRP